MVLVQANRNLGVPNAASTKFVDIPSLSHKDITWTKHCPCGLAFRHINVLNVPQVNSSDLDVCDSKVRIGNS